MKRGLRNATIPIVVALLATACTGGGPKPTPSLSASLARRGGTLRVGVITEDDKDLAAKMLRRALEKRTGKTVLPFDLEEEMRAAFGNFDPGTGEVYGDGTTQ